MGLREDVLVLLGILPLGRPNFKNKKSEVNLYTDKIKQLQELNGQFIWIKDFHNGILSGNLKYIPLIQDRYFLSNYNNSEETKMLKIHDLEKIF